MTTQITEGQKFTITGKLKGQVGRVFIQGKSGIVTEVKVMMAGTKFENTIVKFKIDDQILKITHGGVAALSEFTSNVSL